MTKTIISQIEPKEQELEPNQVLKALSKYYRKPARAVIEFLYTQGYTYDQVAKIIKVSRQRVEQLYPKPKEVTK